MSHADGFLMRREVPEDELLGAVSRMLGIDRDELAPLMSDLEASRVRYDVRYPEEGLRTQLDLYNLPVLPDPVTASVALAAALDTDVVHSPPAESRWSDNPNAWICARPAGEVGILIQADPEVLDVPESGPIIPLD